MEQQKIEVNYMTDKCAVKSCKWISQAPNNENALDIVLQGGYGDFIDYFGEDIPPYFRLCHKHAHKFADWINDDKILFRRNHYHSKREPGYWFGHVGEPATWLAFITTFLYYLKLDNLKIAVGEIKYLHRSAKMWNRKDINDLWDVFSKKVSYEIFDTDMNGIITTKDFNLSWNNRDYRSLIKK